MNRTVLATLAGIVIPSLLIVGTAPAEGARRAKGDPTSVLTRNGEVVMAARVAGEMPTDPGDGRFENANPLTVRLYPQVAAEPRAEKGVVREAAVRAIHTEAWIAFLVEWADPDRSDVKQGTTDTFADAAALQFPLKYGEAADRLPYVGMGGPERPVNIWLWRNGGGGGPASLKATGFGTLEPVAGGGAMTAGKWENGRVRVLFARSFGASSPEEVKFAPKQIGLVPVALAVWGGEKGERGGLKTLSGWRFVKFDGGKVSPAYVRSFGWNPKIRGDAKTGETLMMRHGCAGCHVYPGNPIPTKIGPGLAGIGGIHRPGYLFESLKDPSAVIVPHKNYYSLKDGQPVSIMAPFSGPERDAYHIVEFLRTLK
ncbi:MAG: hypothetical protein A2V83_04495 [Nitrospirae bacterium RBG_16_64_22]|nr:MAG: hypothetical protein A2V83_04495 [Nitrospirae bacterium RBG_16_64_22]